MQDADPAFDRLRIRRVFPVGVEQVEVAAGNFMRLRHEGSNGTRAAGRWWVGDVVRALRQDAAALGQRQRGEQQGGQRDGSAPELQPLRSRDSGIAWMGGWDSYGSFPCKWLSDTQRGDRVPQAAVER